MKPNYAKQIAVLLAIWCISASAFAQYVWLDEHGIKQYSDVAPPPSVPNNRILKQPHAAAIQLQSDKSAEKPADAASDDATKAPMTTADKEADYKKRKLEQEAKDKKIAEETKRKQANEENCTRAKAYLESLKSGMRITTTDSNGERSYLTDDDRAKEVSRAQESIDSCNK